VGEKAMENISFRKSSYSNATGECVEVASYSPRLVAVRDSKDSAGSRLLCSAAGWQEFVTQVREGHDPAS
jgi:hypothetical protein